MSSDKSTLTRDSCAGQWWRGKHLTNTDRAAAHLLPPPISMPQAVGSMFSCGHVAARKTPKRKRVRTCRGAGCRGADL